MTGITTLAPVLAGHIAAVNAFDEDAIYDKTNLPDELVLTNYFTVRDGKIVTLIVIRNTVAS